MGVTFIGNPFDQETEYDDEDWEMNQVEEWLIPAAQNLDFFGELEREGVDIFLHEEESIAEDDSDEDYNPEEDEFNYDFEENEDSDFQNLCDSNDEAEEEEEIDYVTYPMNVEETSEPVKPDTTEAPNTGESSDTD